MLNRAAAPAWTLRCRLLGAELIFFATVACLLMLPSLIDGPPHGHSYHLNVTWIDGFSEQMEAGDPYPRWLERVWAGAGGADFFFYGPLNFWLAGGLKIAVCPGCSADRIIVLGGVFWLALSGLGFRSLAQRFTGRWPALGGAVVYMALPYHLGIDWSDRQAMGEFAAAALLPWHLAAFLDCAKGRRAGPRLAILSALVALCHLPTGIILAVGCVALLPFVEREPGWRSIARIGCAASVGLGISAIYWLPALAELGSVDINLMTEGYFGWRRWSLTLANLQADDSFIRFLWFFFIALTYATVVAAIWLRHWRPALVDISLVLTAVVWVMVTPLSLPAWLWTPIDRIQFPWRFLLLSDISFGLVAALAFEVLASGAAHQRKRIIAATVLAAMVVISVAEHPGVRRHRGGPSLAESFVPLSIGGFEWLPAEFGEARRAKNYQDGAALVRELLGVPKVSAGPEGQAALVSRSARRLGFAVDLAAPARVVFRNTYWRHWRLTNAATGAELPLSMTERFPLTEAVLPAGRASYILELPVLRSERTGFWLSGAFLLMLVGWFLLNRTRRRS